MHGTSRYRVGTLPYLSLGASAILLLREPVRTTASQHEQGAWIFMKSHDLLYHRAQQGWPVLQGGGGFDTPKG